MEDYTELIILIAEDDDGHAELIQAGLREYGISNTIIRFINGEEAWNYLQENKLVMESNIFHYLLLLDLNMPKMSGLEVLKGLKSDLTLKNIPVVVLTTTDDPSEIKECYRLGCNIYITKPVDFKKFTESLNKLNLFLKITNG